MLHELPTISILHKKENMIFIMEMSVEFNDVRVIELVVNFQLQDELVYHVVFLEGGLEDFLQSIDGASLAMPTNMDIAELARPNTNA